MIKHPIIDCELALVGKERLLDAKQYEVLCEELSGIAYCCPHLIARIRYLADQLNLPEVKQYCAWCEEKLRRTG